MADKRKVAFVVTEAHHRAARWHGEAVRSGGVGVSGTEQTCVVVAEQLAATGAYDCVVACSSCEHGAVTRGVRYATHLSDAEWGDLDACITVSWNYDVPARLMKAGSDLIVTCACVDMVKEAVLQEAVARGVRIKVVHVSHWGRDATHRFVPWYRQYVRPGHEAVIPNPLMADVMEDVLLEEGGGAPASGLLVAPRDDRNLVFHASYERGGGVAARVAERLGGTLQAFNYHQGGAAAKPSADKRTLFKQLLNSGFFVYPLALPCGKVHKDTFACCVAEALAMGVHVVSWPVAALPELYDGLVHWARMPSGASPNVSSHDRFATDPTFLSAEALDSLVDAVRRAAAMPEQEQMKWRARGAAYARSAFDPARVGAMYRRLLEA